MKNSRKRSIRYAIAGARVGVIGLAIFAVLSVLVEAQIDPTEPIEVGPDSTRSFSLDFTGMKEDGEPGALVAHVEFEYVATTGSVATKLVKVPLVPVVGTNTVSMKLVLAGVPSGIFRMRARWYDQASQPSKLSEPAIIVRNTAVPPAAPTNVGVAGS